MNIIDKHVNHIWAGMIFNKAQEKETVQEAKDMAEYMFAEEGGREKVNPDLVRAIDLSLEGNHKESQVVYKEYMEGFKKTVL